MAAAPTCPRCGGLLLPGAARCEECGHVLDATVGPSGEATSAPAAAPPGARRLIAGLGCGILMVMVALLSIIALFGLLMGGLLGAAAART